MEGNRIEKSTDLLRGVTLTRLDRLFAEGDKGAHKFVIGLTLGNSVVTLDSGATVTGHFIRADDSTLPPIKGTVEEGKAVLTLPEGAYKITGYFSLIIKANVGEMSCAVFWGDGAITRTSTDTIVDPDHTIPSLDELLTKIAAVDDAIARADAAAEAARQAAQSANFTVLDHYDTLDLLKVAHPTGKPGDAYAIGMEEPYDVHIWGVDMQDWVNIGQLQGATGATGPQGETGAPGYTPVRGKDYWTEEDKAEVEGYIEDQVKDQAAAEKQKYGKSVFFGDSISVGENNGDYSFVDILSESGAFESVTKRAVSGSTIGPYGAISESCLVNQIERYAQDIQNADVVFLEYGANDTAAIANNEVQIGFESDLSTDSTVCGYARKAIERIKELNPAARVIWLAFYRWKPESKTFAYVNDIVIGFEAAVYRLLGNMGCGIIDMTDGFEYNRYLSDDGVHPTTRGHMYIAQNVMNNIFSNNVQIRPYRVFTVTTTDGVTYTADGTFGAMLSMIRAGGVDVTIKLKDSSSGMDLIARLQFYGDLYASFIGHANYNNAVQNVVIGWAADEQLTVQTV